MPRLSSAFRASLLSAACLLALALASGTHAATPAEVEALVVKRDVSALAQAQLLAKAQPRSAEAFILLARAQLQAGKAAEAIHSARTATRLDPEAPRAWLWLGNSLGMRIGQVNMLRKMAIAPDLRDAFETALRLDPDLLDARQALVPFYLQAPAAMGGGVDKAKTQVAEILRRNPVRGHLMQAAVDRFNKDEAAMGRSVDAAVAAAPRLPVDDIDSRTALVVNLVALQRYAQARDFLFAWGQSQPHLGAPQYQLGRLAAISGQYLDEGAAGLKRYLDGGLTRTENDPGDTYAWWRLGQIQAKQGDTAAARASLQTALRINPKNTEAEKALDAL